MSSSGLTCSPLRYSYSLHLPARDVGLSNARVTSFPNIRRSKDLLCLHGYVLYTVNYVVVYITGTKLYLLPWFSQTKFGWFNSATYMANSFAQMHNGCILW